MSKIDLAQMLRKQLLEIVMNMMPEAGRLITSINGLTMFRQDVIDSISTNCFYKHPIQP